MSPGIPPTEEGEREDGAPLSALDPPTLAFRLRPTAGATLAPAETPPRAPELPESIGAYRVLSVLGRGGMGTVLLAEQGEPLLRKVALKLIRKEYLGAERLSRFETEAQALGRMSHPNIAQVFEAGRGPDGQPYLAMEHVPGLPITTFCDRQAIPLAARLDLFAAVCDGVQHAHQKAVLHRDLKPSNVLVTEAGGKPRPKIIDFGLATTFDPALDPTSETESSETDAAHRRLGSSHSGHSVLGTLAYSSPEAIDPSTHGGEPDTRSDVYSLGVLLYELLVGARPFPDEGREELMRRILAGNPPLPSELFAAFPFEKRASRAARRGLSAAALLRALRGDLDAIVGQAMARDRAQRYAWAAELASDIRCWREHRPVVAGQGTALYQTRKFLRRHWVGATTSVLVALALIGGIAARSIEAGRANREAARANREAEASRRVSDFLADLFALSDPGTETRRDLTAGELLDRGAQRLRRDPHLDPLVRARLLDKLGDIYRSLGLYPKAEELLREALVLRERHLGKSAPEVGATERRLSTALRYQGRLDEAEALLLRSLEVSRRPGASMEERANGLLELASVDRARNRLADAEAHLKEVIVLREKAFGPEDERVAAALNNLGNLYYDQERFAESEALHLRSLAIKRKALGPDHLFVAQSLANLSNVYIEMKRLPEAESLQEAALAIKRKTLPAGHPEIGVSLLNLGEIAFNLRQFERAERDYRGAMEVWRVQLPADHPYFAYAWGGIANIERETGRGQQAARDYERALDLARKGSPPGSPLLKTLEADRAKLRPTKTAGTTSRRPS